MILIDMEKTYDTMIKKILWKALKDKVVQTAYIFKQSKIV